MSYIYFSLLRLEIINVLEKRQRLSLKNKFRNIIQIPFLDSVKYKNYLGALKSKGI